MASGADDREMDGLVAGGHIAIIRRERERDNLEIIFRLSTSCCYCSDLMFNWSLSVSRQAEVSGEL